MKLLLVTHYFSTHGGGVELVAEHLAHHLIKQTAELTIDWYASGVDDTPPLQQSLTYHGIRAWNGIEKRTGVPCPIWSVSGLKQLWKGIRNCDLIHFHDYAYTGNIAAAFFCLLQCKPYVVTQHIGFVPFKQKLLRPILEYLNRTLGRAILNRAFTVVFISAEVQSYFKKRGVSQKTLLVPNGVQSHIFHPVTDEQKNALREHLNIPAKKPIVLFVGRFVEKKGLPLLIELAGEEDQYHWIFAGRGPLDPQQKLTPLPPHVQVYNDKKGQQVAELYQIADLLILPSVGEGFPLVVQEALACGTPVLVENALSAALPEAAAWMNMESLGQSDDKERWSKRLQHVLMTPEPAQKRFERAHFAQQAWSWQNCAEIYLEIFDKAIQRRKNEN